MTKAAVALYSGGLDSTTAMFWAKVQGYEVIPLTIFYGQSHDLPAGSVAHQRVFDALGVDESYVVGLPEIGHSPLTGHGDVPMDADIDRPGVAETYVPGRNMILLSWANSLAEELGIDTIIGGFNAVDYSGYPDCRMDFLTSFALTATYSRGYDPNERRVQVLAPFVDETKTDIIKWAHAHSVPFDATSTCYEPVRQEGTHVACGRCDACRIRLRGFAHAGLEDPIPYHQEAR